MPHRSRSIILALALSGSTVLSAQDAGPPLVVRTFTLKVIRAADAAKLVSPYILSPKGGVFEAGRDIRAITIRETQPNLARIAGLLREHDQPPATFRLRFQLIAAEDAAARDPAIAGIDSTLRSLFRFGGYRLLSQESATANEQEQFLIMIPAGDERLQLSGGVGGLLTVGAKGSVQVNIRLIRTQVGQIPGTPPLEPGNHRSPGFLMPETLLTSGLTIPLGQTIVLGSTAPGGNIRALILVVRPELISTPKP